MSKNNTANLSAEHARKISQKLSELYDKLDKKEFMPRARPYNWEDLNDDKLEVASKLAYHCCVNGPVGVSRPKNFPGFKKRICIKTEFGCSSAQWKGFCYVYRDFITEDKSTSKAVEMFGDFWPTEEEMNNRNKSNQNLEEEEQD
jgi:hypothetical protein